VRLLLDLQSVQGPAKNRGLGRYTIELACAIARHPAQPSVGVLLNGGGPSADLLDARSIINRRLPTASIHVFDAPWPWLDKRSNDVAAHVDAEYVRNEFIRDLAPDAVLVCSLFEWPSRSVLSIPRADRPFTAVVGYDMLQLTDPNSAVPAKQVPMLEHRLDSMRNADLVLAISDFTNHEICRVADIAADRIRTIWGASATARQTRGADAERVGVLCTGGDTQRKNEAATVRAFAQLPSDIRKQHPLTVVGRL